MAIIVISLVTVSSLSTEFEPVGQTAEQPQMIKEESIDVTGNDINGYFKNIRNDTQKLKEFFSDMPKGGDLHNHLSGSTSTEDLIKIAKQYNFCIDAEMKLKDESAPNCPPNTLPVSNAKVGSPFYISILEKWSMYNFNNQTSGAGHDQFFSSFDKFGPLSKYKSSMLGYWKITANEQNMSYMETMLNDESFSHNAKKLAKKIELSNPPYNFTKMYDKIKSDTRIMAQTSANNIEALEKNSTKFCKSHGNVCDTKFLYINQIHRTEDLTNVFAQMVLSFEIVKQTDLVIAINMVGPEDKKISMDDYLTHMEILQYLSEEPYKNENITLHAGELSLALRDITKDDMKNHIFLAIHNGGATRIGHGVDIKTEILSHVDLYDWMKDKLIAVEVPLTSNKIILEIEYRNHPIIDFVYKGVPVVLSTDDPGILRTNMTNEYVIATNHYDEFDYEEFKKINRNSLEFSFLPGKSLWIDSTYTKKLPKCSNSISQDCWRPTVDQKATIQSKFEHDLNEFESNFS